MKLIMSLILTMVVTQVNAFTLIAHRGLPMLYPEHTMSSLNAALDALPDYVEPDVVLTKDNKFIVIHDIHLETTTDVAEVFPKRKRADGKYYAIDFTLDEIKQLKFDHRINFQTKQAAISGRERTKDSAQKVLTLDAFIERLNTFNKTMKKNIGLYVEFKSPEFHNKEGKDIASLLAKKMNHALVKTPSLKIIVQCFHDKSLKKIRGLLPKKVKTVQLYAENSWKESSTDYEQIKTLEGMKEIAKFSNGIGLWLGQLNLKSKYTDQIIKNAKSLGLIVHVYTVRTDQLPKEIESESQLIKTLVNKKVDGAFSDNVINSKKYL